MLTDSQRQLIKLDKKKLEVKEFFDQYTEALQAVVEEHGLGGFFQDEEGTVYTTVIPEGKFMYFDKLACHRTRRLSADEKKGDLSLTKAREAGFLVEGK